jgi:hypothetical protein
MRSTDLWCRAGRLLKRPTSIAVIPRGTPAGCTLGGSRLAAMSVTVELSEELLAVLRAESKRRGVTIEALIAESLNEHVRASRPRRNFALAGIGASDGTRFARDADEMLAEGFGSD